jgi:hypothetical protein
MKIPPHELWTAESGTLNNKRVGSESPRPIPCEVCGCPVYLGKGIVAIDRQGRRQEVDNAVFELANCGFRDCFDYHRCRDETQSADKDNDRSGVAAMDEANATTDLQRGVLPGKTYS